MSSMRFYEVLVASQQYHGHTALTYSSDEALADGTVVVVPLRKQSVLGVVHRQVTKPKFAAKEITKSLSVTIPIELIELILWLTTYYPAPLGQLLTLLLPTSLKQKSREGLKKAPPASPQSQPPLTNEQQKTVSDILISPERMHLLHGDTGSGKTRVYIELIQEAITRRKSVILLTPEIGLTPQLTESIEKAFPGISTVLHSNLTPAERRNRWLKIAEHTEPQIVIGPRSALFAPLHSVGFIILDESHDNSYKQEQAPYYLTSRVAAKLAERHGAKVVLGSATPLVSDYYAFKQKKLPIHRMGALAKPNAYTSDTEVIDLRDRASFIKSAWLSDSLIKAISETYKEHNQSLIFLNRRGSARVVLCQACGWQAVCPRCDLTLTYHGDSHQMRCHTCGYTVKAPVDCPTCKSADITFKSIGTKALVEEIQKLFPNARVMRFDGDNLKSERLESHYETITSGKVDIIVGTQLLAKGLDLPRLGMVGVALADTSLFFPDFTAEEHLYQLISQVTGRANRGHRNTKIIVQTYHPDNETLKFALAKDYAGFYERQLSERQTFGFPPFKYVLKLRAERATAKSAESAIKLVRNKLLDLGLHVEISEPSPAFIEKIHDRYRWQIIIKSARRATLVDTIAQLPANITYDIDPSNLL